MEKRRITGVNDIDTINEKDIVLNVALELNNLLTKVLL